jgi:chromate transporter
MHGLIAYFLRLGTFGFGGPIALAGAMQRDLVEERKWFTPEQYVRSLALAQLAPGPLAAQLAMALGWVRGGWLGATAVGVAFVLPSFAMVLALSAVYVRFHGLAGMQAAFYGVGASVIAIIARSALKLTKMTLKRDALLWVIFGVAAVVTAWTEREIIWLFLLAGLVAAAFRMRRMRTGELSAIAPWLVAGAHGIALPSTLWRILLYFSEAGAFVFGSGLAVVPFLYGGVVERFHWLTQREFVDAVAVAMITPGPVVITVGFIGYLVAGPIGATLAAVAVFLPCWLIVIIVAPWYERLARYEGVAGFVAGITAAATGAITGAVYILGRRSIVDLPTMAIALLTLAALTLPRRKIHEPLLIALAAVAGLALKWLG